MINSKKFHVAKMPHEKKSIITPLFYFTAPLVSFSKKPLAINFARFSVSGKVLDVILQNIHSRHNLIFFSLSIPTPVFLTNFHSNSSFSLFADCVGFFLISSDLQGCLLWMHAVSFDLFSWNVSRRRGRNVSRSGGRNSSTSSQNAVR